MEKPVVFGEAANLFGIVNVPETLSSRTAVVMLTAGMLHHVGSFRFHVLLARELESCGILSLRFDLSGIGESIATGYSGSSLERAAYEASQAIDLLNSDYEIDNIILFGLCSGADDGWFIAKKDRRVIALAMIDGLGYPTKAHQRLAWLDKARRLATPSYWNAKIRRTRNESQSESANLPLGTDIREFPSQDQATVDLQEFCDRQMRILACYTGGTKEYYNYESQFEEMFAGVEFTGCVEHVFYPNMDHVALLKEDRRVLLDRFSHWIKRIAQDQRSQKEKVTSV